MTFKRGHNLATGRPPGSKNRRTEELEAKCKEHGCDPFEVLLLFAAGDWKALGYDNSVYVKESADGSTTTLAYTISPELRVQAAKEACQYIMPKKKSIEHVTNNLLEGMTAAQRLEAMKQAVRMLEGEMNEAKPAITG